jgi:virulence factor
MRIGVLGIGDIAKKGYLPVLVNQKDIQVIPCTRNADTLKDVMERYHLTEGYTDVDEFLSKDLDGVYVTAATSAHYALSMKVIDAGIPLHLDKPISLDYTETQNLVEYAQAKNNFLMIGFNRRFVPIVKKVHDEGKPDIVVYQKNRDMHPDNLRRFIVEDFVHVVDTTRYLLQDEIIELRVHGKKEGDTLLHVVVNMITPSNQGILIMNYLNGVTEEIIEVSHPHKKSIIRNLAQLEVYDHSDFIKKPESDWIPTLKKRGFEDLRDAFLNAIKTKAPSPVDGPDALRTHQLCEEIVTKLESQ